MSRYPQSYPYESRNNGPSMPVIGGAIAACVLLFTLAVVVSITSCGGGPKSTKLVVGINTPFPPFDLAYGETLQGFDVDLANLIAKQTHRQLVLKDLTEFDALLPSLGAGKLDMVISAVSITDARSDVVSFSDPYFNADQAFLTLKTTALTNASKLGYQVGTTSEDWVKKNYPASGVELPDMTIGIQFLKSKEVDAIVLDAPAASALAKDDSAFMVARTVVTDEKYGVAVQHGDPQGLLPSTNAVIKKLQDSGEYQKLVTKWFGGKG